MKRKERQERKTEHQLNRVEKDLVEIDCLLETISHERCSKPLTAAIAVRFTGDSLMANNALILTVGQTSQASIIPLLADEATNSGGALSNVAYVFTDPSATVVLNADGTATVTGVSASVGSVSGTASATVTDTNGVVTSYTDSFTITTLAVVVAPPPVEPLTQSIAVVFTAPVFPSDAPVVEPVVVPVAEPVVETLPQS